MSNIQPYALGGSSLPSSSGALSVRDARSTGRSLSRLSSQSTLAIARVDATAELQAVKVEAGGQVAHRAMTTIALLTQTEQQLAQAVPLAASRLQAIGDMAALAAADIVADTAWKLKRL